MPTEEEIAAQKKAEEEAAAKKAAEGKPGEISLEQVVTAMRSLVQSNQSMTARLQQLESRPVVTPKTPVDEKKTVNDNDLEKMDRGELVRYIVDTVKSSVVGPLAKSQEEDLAKREAQDLRRQVDEVSSKYEDFYEFKDEIQAVLKEHPKMNIEDVYTLARNRNSDKAAQIDAKVAEKDRTEQEAKEKKEAEEKASEFGGLYPTSTMTHRSDKMAPKDAADAAWEEIGMSDSLSAFSE